MFVSLVSGETFRLDSVELQLDGRAAAYHIYTFKELDALQKGGVQRLYTGNVRSGSHDLLVTLIGKSKSGADVRQKESFKFNKKIGPKIVEICLAAQTLP